ncbi:hypothetical protein AB0M44_42340 [Streptosporangium subroseum]|uniref:hypothetical protein n=1 Tax=Streptosporangium subroseum TaxID=106412 RepID=UPI00342E90AE
MLGLARAYFEAIRPLLLPGWELEVTTYHGDQGDRTVTYNGRSAPAAQDDGQPPNGCLLCGIEEYGHGSLYKTGTGYHYWETGTTCGKGRGGSSERPSLRV